MLLKEFCFARIYLIEGRIIVLGFEIKKEYNVIGVLIISCLRVLGG